MSTQTLSAKTKEHAAGHPVVSHERWIAARKELLKKEKELSRQMDEVAAERRKLPWTKVDKEYVFEGPSGKKTLAELFDGRSQLIVYHFMFGPDWEEGCPGCSFLADHIDGANLHLAHHDVTLLCVSRAPLAKLQAYEKRMGWNFQWFSSLGSDFNHDYQVTAKPNESGQIYYNFEMTEASGEEHPGISVFYKDEAGTIYHTYSAYARGGDILIGAHNYLDLTPKGRNEVEIMDWVRRHDRYEDPADSCCGNGGGGK